MPLFMCVSRHQKAQDFDSQKTVPFGLPFGLNKLRITHPLKVKAWILFEF